MRSKLVLFLTFLVLATGCASADINITAYTPLDLTPSTINGSGVVFSANFSDYTECAWLLNGSTERFEESASYTEYNYTTNGAGDFNITIITPNTQQEWLLTVTSVVLDDAIHAGFWQKWTGTGWAFLNSTPTNNSASLAGQLEVIVS